MKGLSTQRSLFKSLNDELGIVYNQSAKLREPCRSSLAGTPFLGRITEVQVGDLAISRHELAAFLPMLARTWWLEMASIHEPSAIGFGTAIAFGIAICSGNGRVPGRTGARSSEQRVKQERVSCSLYWNS